MKKYYLFTAFLLSLAIFSWMTPLSSLYAEVETEERELEVPISSSSFNVFNDDDLLDGYTEEYKSESKEILLEMIKDTTLNSYKSAAAVKVFRENFSEEVFSREKKIVEKILLRRLNQTNSAFVQVEIMLTLCVLDRYRYFKPMVPALIQKLDHYNRTVNSRAADALNQIIKHGQNRAREARIVYVTLRKILFLQRRVIATMKEPDENLERKLDLLRWSVKILGNDVLDKLPNEVLHML